MYERDEAQFLTPGGHPVTMTYRRDTNDWNTLNASLDGDEYHLPDGLTGYALDVGGYLGSVGIALAKDNPGLAVTIIEPVPDNGDLIEVNIERNGLDERVVLIRGAVGNGGESVDVWYGYRGTETAEHHAFVGNSSLAYDHGGSLDHQTVTYRALPLSGFTPLDFLKIDCEGGEWAFLDSPAVADVAVIVGEAHCVRGHKGGDIVGLLAATHDVTIIGDPETTCEFRAVLR
jgi:FkbM family methyltransferase